jgi:hypothetical protein
MEFALAFFMGGLWLWNAVAYHAWLFTRINPAAWLFSALFAVEGALFFWTGSRPSLRFLSASGPRQIIGVALAAYSLIYPFLTNAVGHSYPAAPTYALARSMQRHAHRLAAASISAIAIGGEQEGEHRGEHALRCEIRRQG